ncbi:hypothetical protein QN277_013616 [Acacia crassicarpa]|uniref:Uncharacterized protein n=1 Tax=Acacia crassicarpa TaxID=499986 RepID=A0AAE1TEJ7_9FABA|nr:hypothetical protein QN277_013616 [Acacia crassicarpa]
MGCGLSTRLNPEDSASVSHGRMSDVHVTDVHSPATGKNFDGDGGGDSVQRGRKDEGEKEEGEKEDEDDHSEELILPRSPSFREYCIASSRSRNQNFSGNDSAFSIKNNGDEDSINKPEDVNKERKKKERRIVGLRNVMPVKGMFIRTRNVVNFSRHH